ncbi:MAG: lactonase family protein [Phycisphaerae bacterium]|nr:lactonase family protein [Phycisphaerae bacterium]
MRFKPFSLFVITMLWLAALSSASADSCAVYFGTYTRANQGSEGIYRSVLDLETGELSAPVLAARANNPSFIEIHPNGRFLAAVSEAGRAGSVSAYAIDATTGQLTLLNQQPSGGSGPCHVSFDRAGQYCLVTNYNSGSASVIPVLPKGLLGDPTACVQHTGASLNPSRQQGPHAHSVNMTPDGRLILVADLGIDKIMIYRLNQDTGALVAHDPPCVPMTPGAGPRHLCFSPNGKQVYVINELNSTVTALAYDSASGRFSEIQTVTTLPQDYKGANGCAEVRVHPSGKFLYGSNRGHNSIVVYRIDPDNGRLSWVNHETRDIKTPRNFNIDPSGQFCVVANQDSASVVVFRIDPGTGGLTPTGHKISIASPVCIRFLSTKAPR